MFLVELFCKLLIVDLLSWVFKVVFCFFFFFCGRYLATAPRSVFFKMVKRGEVTRGVVRFKEGAKGNL